MRCDHAQAIWPDDPQRGELGACGENLLFELFATGAGLAKAGRDDDHAGHAELPTTPNQIRNRRSRRAKDHQIGDMRQSFETGVSRDSLHGLAMRIDRIDNAIKALPDEIVQQNETDLAGVSLAPTTAIRCGRKILSRLRVLTLTLRSRQASFAACRVA